MIIKNLYTSVACNRTPEAADWGTNGLVVFAANHAVNIYVPQYSNNSAKIIRTYVEHSKRVNIVRWLKNPSNSNTKETHFISGGDDGLAILWNITELNEPLTYPLIGHSGSVNAVDGLQYSNGIWLLVSASSESLVKLWHFYESESSVPVCVQTLNISPAFCLTSRLTWLPNTENPLLAFSTEDGGISLWCEQTADSNEFQLVHRLIGHENWVRGLDFVQVDGNLLLASCSQDNTIRLWRIFPHTVEGKETNKNSGKQLVLDELDEIKMEEKILCLSDNRRYAITLESVLCGHDGWVYSVHWYKSPNTQTLYLLSSSIDKTMIIWKQMYNDGVWMELVRLGEMGGNTLGFYGGKFSADGKSVLGYSYYGSFHMWTEFEEELNIWLPKVTVGGHFGDVRDLAWEHNGKYLITVSGDQTTRLHAPWHRKDVEKETWHELSRPQVHGYDIKALAILSRYRFASGAEEKIVRAFQAPANFVDNFRHLTHLENDGEGDELMKNLPKGASVPSLGLSNKAIYNDGVSKEGEEKTAKVQYPEHNFKSISLKQPPQEETLMENTLWPEMQKLYGHGYEIFALTATRDGRVLASSCKANDIEHAQVILWNTKSWKQYQKLASHHLTVTQMRFSPNDKYLLTVSRDRCWSLFAQNEVSDSEGALPTFTLLSKTNKSNGLHTRIIWSCDWTHDSLCFLTTSREGKAVIWNKTTTTTSTAIVEKKCSLNGWLPLAILQHGTESLTAVACAPYSSTNNAYMVALGCERGAISIYEFLKEWKLLLTLNTSQAHHDAVKRLQFRPSNDLSKDEDHYQLASCGADHFVRIYDIKF